MGRSIAVLGSIGARGAAYAVTGATLVWLAGSAQPAFPQTGSGTVPLPPVNVTAEQERAKQRAAKQKTAATKRSSASAAPGPAAPGTTLLPTLYNIAAPLRQVEPINAASEEVATGQEINS